MVRSGSIIRHKWFNQYIWSVMGIQGDGLGFWGKLGALHMTLAASIWKRQPCGTTFSGGLLMHDVAASATSCF